MVSLGSIILVNPTMQQRGCCKSNNNNNNGQEVVFETNAWVEPIPLFGSIYQPKPSAERAILLIINGNDVVAHAQSGTGKTFKISVVACEMVDTSPSFTMVRTLFLSPRRELALQTEEVILVIANYKNMQESSSVGGKSVGEDIRMLEYGVHVVSGTHGRVCDMVKRTSLTRAIKLLDESDEMLTRGFKDQIYDVYKYLPPELQVAVISGILPIEIVNIMSEVMTDPIRMLVKHEESTLEEMNQFFFAGEKEEWKTGALYYLHHTLIITQAVIFCSTSQMDGTWLWLSAKLLQQDNKDTIDLLVLGNDVSNRCETSEVPLLVDVLRAAASATLK